MSEVDQSLSLHPHHHEDELFAIKKQMRSQDAEWKKNKAVLEQRIEILELQNRELKEREENLKKMNNSIFGALNDFNKENDPASNKAIKELESSKEQLAREFGDYRIRSQEILKNLENENKDLREKVTELDGKCNRITLEYEKSNASFQQRVLNLDGEKKNLTMMLQLFEEERKQFKEKESNQGDIQAKMTELRLVLEKQVTDHKAELEKVHNEYKQAINNIKIQAGADRNSMEKQIHKLLDSKKLDGTLFEDIKKNYENEFNRLKKEKENIQKSNKSLEHQVAQLNETIKKLEEKFNQEKLEHDKDTKEYRKLRSKNQDVDGQMRKFETNEKALKQSLIEKDFKMEEMAGEFKKKLANEKRRSEQNVELLRKYKEDSERKITIIMQEIMKKEETIKKLRSQLKKKDDNKSAKKSENDTSIMQTNYEQAKTNTSLINISLVSQSVSMSKFNPGRSFLQEVKTNRDHSAPRSTTNPLQRSQSNASKDFKYSRNVGKESYREKSFFGEDEDDPKDITSENILLGLNSPRIPSNGANTYRNHSSNKRDTEMTLNTHRESRKHTIADLKKGSKPVLGIDLCEACAHETEQQQQHSERNLVEDDNNCYSYRESNPQNYSNTSFEMKRRTSGMQEPSLRFNNNNNNERNSAVYASIDLGKAINGVKNPNGNGGRLSEFGTDTSIHGEKKGFNLNRSASNLAKGPQEVSVSASYVGLQQSRSEFLGQGRGTRNNFDDEEVSIMKDRLSEAEYKAEKVNLEKEKLQVELDRLVLELKQTKMEWALSEEGKEESELALKNEIKFLINKLLQVKNSTTNLTATAAPGDLSQVSKSVLLNKSTMDQHSSFINNSEYLNISQFNPLTNNFVSSSSHQFEQNNFLAMQNSHIGERKVNESLEKKPMRKMPKVPYDGYSKTPLQDRCLNAEEYEVSEDSSSSRVSEFTNNENSLVLNMLSTNSNPKKLIKNIK